MEKIDMGRFERKKIDLDPFNIKLSEAEKRLEVAKKAAFDAEQHVSEVKKGAHASVCLELVQGGTTGNPLLDEIIRDIGFEPTRIEKLLAFNEKIQASRGKELLIITRWQLQMKHVKMPTDRDRNEFDDRHAYLFGRLTGERIKITGTSMKGIIPGACYAIELPFERYVEVGLRNEAKNRVVHIGPAILRSGCIGLDGSGLEVLTRHIFGDEKTNTGPPEPSDEKCGDVYFSDELENGSVNLFYGGLKGLREALNAPTPEEAIQASHI